MTTYQVNMEHMSYVEGEMQALSQKIRAMLEELDQNVQQSLQHWDSAAKTAYQQKKVQWDAAAAHMQQLVTKAAQGLNTIGSSYNDGEKFGTNLWEG